MEVSGTPLTIIWTGPRSVKRNIVPLSPSHRGRIANVSTRAVSLFLRNGYGGTTMETRMKPPAAIVPGVVQPIQELMKAAHSQGVPEELLEIVHLRVSQINGCSFCVDAGLKS